MGSRREVAFVLSFVKIQDGEPGGALLTEQSTRYLRAGLSTTCRVCSKREERSLAREVMAGNRDTR